MSQETTAAGMPRAAAVWHLPGFDWQLTRRLHETEKPRVRFLFGFPRVCVCEEGVGSTLEKEFLDPRLLPTLNW